MGETAEPVPWLEFPLGWFLRLYRTSGRAFAVSLLRPGRLSVRGSEGGRRGWQGAPSMPQSLLSLLDGNISVCLALAHEELAEPIVVSRFAAAAITPGTRSRSRVGRPHRDIQHTHYHPQIVRFGLGAMGCRGPHTYSADASPDLYLPTLIY